MRRWLKKQVDGLRAKREQRKVAFHSRLKARYHIFRALLASNNRAVDALTEIAILLRLQGDAGALTQLVDDLISETAEMVVRLDHLAPSRFRGLYNAQRTIAERIRTKLPALKGPENLAALLPLARVHPGLKGQTGNKAAALAALRQKGLTVPDGFVVSLAGCRLFLEHGGLSMQLVHLLAAHQVGQGAPIPPAAAQRVQELIRSAELPAALAEEIKAAARPYFASGKGLAVRSSSISEDGQQHSFAGQFSSVLNVRDETQLLAAFKEVAASNFNPRSLAYRINAGLDPLRFDMAVLCLEMVEAQAAGILLSRSPQEPDSGLMLISAVPGLGEAAVSGSAAADLYLVDRQGMVDWSRSTIATKERLLSCQAEGGIAWQAVDEEKSQQPVLDAPTLKTLAAWGSELEAREGVAVDMEWAVDRNGAPVILQMRPLTSLGPSREDDWQAASSALLQGVIAAPGRASGRARIIRSRRDLAELPQEPTVLVMHQSFVDAVNLLGQVAAVLVDLGSPADHLACVAREQETPMLCSLQDGGRLLSPGQWLTVDANHGRVYAAEPDEIEQAKAHWQPGVSPATLAPLPPLYLELRELITALHLTDAYGPTFSILECRSLHDIVRFVHEKAVLAMFEAGDELLEENLGLVHTVEAPVPFFVSVIDMGGGLALEGVRKRRIPPEMVISRPFRALWQGITTPGLHWGPPPGGAPMGSVMSAFLTDQKSERPIGMPNYCLVSRDYCNMNARMDFHFIMIDTVASPEARSNHIKFRFKGGGTAMDRRRRRALCIGEIFEHYGFAVDVRDDLVNAALQGAERAAIEEKLVMVGRILGFTRLLDAAMGSDEMISQVAEAFLKGDYSLATIPGLNSQA